MSSKHTSNRPLPIWQYMKRMWRFAPAIVVAHAFLWGLVNLLLFAPGFLMSRYLGLLETDGDRRELNMLVGLVACVAIVVSLLIMAAGYFEINMRFRMSGLVRFNLLRRLLRRPGALPLPYPLGQTISRFRDDGYAAEDVMDWTDEIVLSTLFAIAALIALARLDAVITIAITIPLVVVVLLTRLLSARITRYREVSAAATGDLASAVSSILSAAPSIQTAGTQRYALEHIAELNARRRSAMIRDVTATNAIRAMSSSISGIGSGLIMLLAADRLRSGSLSIGDFTLFLLWIGYLVQLTRELGEYLAFMQQAKVAYRRLDAMIEDAPPESLVEHASLQLTGPAPDYDRGALRVLPPLERLSVDALTYCHTDGETRLRGISDITFTANRGELVVITGKIGSGKSTLVRALLGQLPAQRGSIFWNDQELDDPSAMLTPPHAGYTPQIPRLFSTTLRNNILLGRNDDAEAIARATHNAVLDQDIATFEHGLESQVGARGLRLSGGQIQRAAAARMLISDSDLLVIDDLSSALDVETERTLWNRIRADGQRTIIAVSHRRIALRLATSILVLVDGHLVAQGSLHELLATSPEFCELWSVADADESELSVRAID